MARRFWVRCPPVLPMLAWVFSGCSSFLHHQNMYVSSQYPWLRYWLRIWCWLLDAALWLPTAPQGWVKSETKFPQWIQFSLQLFHISVTIIHSGYCVVNKPDLWVNICIFLCVSLFCVGCESSTRCGCRKHKSRNTFTNLTRHAEQRDTLQIQKAQRRIEMLWVIHKKMKTNSQPVDNIFYNQCCQIRAYLKNVINYS